MQMTLRMLQSWYIYSQNYFYAIYSQNLFLSAIHFFFLAKLTIIHGMPTMSRHESRRQFYLS